MGAGLANIISKVPLSPAVMLAPPVSPEQLKANNGHLGSGAHGYAIWYCYVSSCCGKRIYEGNCLGCGEFPKKFYGPVECGEFARMIEALRAWPWKYTYGANQEFGSDGRHEFWGWSTRGNRQYLNV